MQAVVVFLNRLEFVVETLRAALKEGAETAGDWLAALAAPEWLDCYSARPEDSRSPSRWAARVAHGDQWKQKPREWLPVLATVLGVSREELEAATAVEEATAPPAPRTVDDFLPPGDPFAQLVDGPGRRVGQSTVVDLTNRVHGLRLADDVVYGRDLIGRARRDLRSAVHLYRTTTHTEAVGRGLLRAIAELAQIVGWVASDAGEYAEAEKVYRLGLSAAQKAGDGTLAGQLLGTLAYQVANQGDPREAVDMAVAAVDAAGPDAPPRARALFLDRVAWAHTRADRPQEAIQALGKAHEALTDEHGADEPDWTYWVSVEELEVMDARVYTELHRPLRAVPLLSQVLDRYDTTHARELALYLSWLAVAYADANEPEEAAATTERMLALSTGGASERTADRARVVLKSLKPFRKVPEVAALLGEYPAA
ncbi:transcriptional regulator [Streptomyces sp. RPA4-5]|uniref:transcriptional regulator n=1 Tax=Streptomyces sp. RPA4-5 TaxID=2721245 RepID=UPI002001DD30|nr:transcriptional regulator [Streptomyces sp. RPA4-5]